MYSSAGFFRWTGCIQVSGVDGAKRGTIIHEVFRGRDAATVLREFGEYSEEHVRECEEIRAAFFASDLMKRVKRSFCEVPFVVTVDGRPVSGKIDRLCELDDGSWVVIDYKSESVTSYEYPSMLEVYKISMTVYMKAVEQFRKGKPVGGGLYNIEFGIFYF